MQNPRAIGHWKCVLSSPRLFCALLLALMPVGASAQDGTATNAASAQHTHHTHASDGDVASASGGELQGDTNVITIRYECASQSSSKTEPCTATVTKSEFDALVEALNPKMSASNRQSLAAEYSRLLIMAAEARRRGVDQSPEFSTLMNFSKLQLLASRLVHEIGANPPSVSSDDVEKHFREHASDYRKVVVSRIFVPALPANPMHGDAPAARRVEAVYARVLKGEDFVTLQREVNGDPPAVHPKVRMGPVRCQSLPDAHRQVCALTPGSISSPFADQLGHWIYRMESQGSVELGDVQAEIRATLERQRLEREIHKARTPLSLALDESYFGKLPSSEVASQHGINSPAVSSPSPKAAHKHHQH